MSIVQIYELERDGKKINEKMISIIKDILDMNEVYVTGKSVLVKPNMLGAFEPQRGATTDPELIKSIVYVLKERKAKAIYVGDSPGGAENGTEGTARKCGLYDAADGCFLNFSKDATIVPIKSRFINEVSVPQQLFKTDILINVPKLKTHGFMGFSACIKNMFGIVIGPYKAKLHFRAPSVEQFGELLVDIYSLRVPDLNIIDAMTVMEGDGPTSGPLRQENLIIAGTNGVVVDQIVAEIMGFTWEEIKYLVSAKKRGLGEWDRENIRVIGVEKKIENLIRPITYGKMSGGNGNNHVKLAGAGLRVFGDVGRMVPKLTRPESCVKCGVCIRNCPAGAIEQGEFPKINYKKCISCYCCAELCHENCYDIWDTGNKMEKMFAGFRQ